MKKPLESKLPAKLARGRRSFEKWRSTHKPRTRLPGHLWSVAEELAGEYGVSKTAHTLGLDYNGLKKRIKPAGLGGSSKAKSRPSFMELLPSMATTAMECTIECEDAKGAKIRIHLKGSDLPDLAALSGGLWRLHR